MQSHEAFFRRVAELREFGNTRRTEFRELLEVEERYLEEIKKCDSCKRFRTTYRNAPSKLEYEAYVIDYNPRYHPGGRPDFVLFDDELDIRDRTIYEQIHAVHLCIRCPALIRRNQIVGELVHADLARHSVNSREEKAAYKQQADNLLRELGIAVVFEGPKRLRRALKLVPEFHQFQEFTNPLKRITILRQQQYPAGSTMVQEELNKLSQVAAGGVEDVEAVATAIEKVAGSEPLSQDVDGKNDGGEDCPAIAPDSEVERQESDQALQQLLEDNRERIRKRAQQALSEAARKSDELIRATEENNSGEEKVNHQDSDKSGDNAEKIDLTQSSDENAECEVNGDDNEGSEPETGFGSDRESDFVGSEGEEKELETEFEDEIDNMPAEYLIVPSQVHEQIRKLNFQSLFARFRKPGSRSENHLPMPKIGSAARKRAMEEFDAKYEGRDIKSIDFGSFRHTTVGRKASVWDVRYAIWACAHEFALNGATMVADGLEVDSRDAHFTL